MRVKGHCLQHVRKKLRAPSRRPCLRVLLFTVGVRLIVEMCLWRTGWSHYIIDCSGYLLQLKKITLNRQWPLYSSVCNLGGSWLGQLIFAGAGGFTSKIVHLLGDGRLSTKWFRLPQNMVARFQEGVFQEKEVGAASFLRSGPGNWYRVTSAEFYSQTITDPRCKVRGYRFHCPCTVSDNLGCILYNHQRDPQSITIERGLNKSSTNWTHYY